mmetsp:Transcript_16993/g.42092  ORF Transcript_16993/g.42092 Transcript_16993/m.42092 type:complete len:202 (+) Transcript_16993:1466-2071(+)
MAVRFSHCCPLSTAKLPTLQTLRCWRFSFCFYWRGLLLRRCRGRVGVLAFRVGGLLGVDLGLLGVLRRLFLRLGRLPRALLLHHALPLRLLRRLLRSDVGTHFLRGFGEDDVVFFSGLGLPHQRGSDQGFVHHFLAVDHEHLPLGLHAEVRGLRPVDHIIHLVALHVQPVHPEREIQPHTPRRQRHLFFVVFDAFMRFACM